MGLRDYACILAKNDFASSQFDYDGYLMMQMNNIEIHFFEFEAMDPAEKGG